MMLEEKIANEFQRYFLSMMATSKENIFAHSDEIEKDREIRRKELLTMLTELSNQEEKISN